MDSSFYQSPTSHDSEGSLEKDYAHDLPENLLNIGWRKFWSKRENREYYYNKVTGSSLWDLNELKLQESNNILNNKRKLNFDKEEITDQKRICYKNSLQSDQLLGPAFVPGSLYNFVSSTYMPMIKGKRPNLSVFLPPHPIIEFERANLLSKLRSQFVNSCMTRENIQPPEGSFNRWLLQMKTIDYGSDPVFPSHCDKIVGSSMKRELLLSLPFPIVKPKYLNLAKTQLIRYSESVKSLVERRNASPPCRKIIKHNVDETLRWIRSSEYRSFDDYIEKLASIKRICQPHIQDLVKESVEKICIKMFNLSQEYALRLRTNHLKLLQQNGIAIPELLLSDLNVEHVIQTPYYDPLKIDENKLITKSSDQGNHELVACHCLGLACPCPLFTSPNTQVSATIQEDLGITDPKSSLVVVEIADLAKFHITKSHLEKLETLYLVNTKDDPEKAAFNCRLWCLLQRYYSYLGCENGSFGGIINQAALPVAVFEVLNRLFDVNFEMFASPLNCYFPQYCSAFHDTDRYFGSCGPALEFFPATGSFEANPPFCEELLLGFVNYVEKLLQHSDLPLSFIVFIPDWRDPPFEALTLLEASAFNRHQMTLRAREHEYRIANFPPNVRGNPNSSTIYAPETLKRSGHSTLVVFLQNNAGFQRWTPTTERLNELMGVYYTANLTNNIPSRRDFDEEYVNSVS